MLTNPYPPPRDSDDLDALRFQTYLSGADKSLLMGLRPVRGTMQCVINHLIKNLCNELRSLNITSYHPDADTILAVLIEPRDLTNSQLERLGRTITSTPAKASAWVQQHQRGTKVRKGTTNAKVGANHSKGKVSGGK